MTAIKAALRTGTPILDLSIPESERASVLRTTADLCITATVVLLPLLISPSGKDTFRTPKDVVFLACGFVLAAVGIVYWARNRTAEFFPGAGRISALFGALLAWTIVTSITSTNISISTTAFLWLLAATAIFIAAVVTGRGRTVNALYWVFIPSGINAIVFLLQRFHIWSPVHFDEAVPLHQQYTALIGNPDDAGSFFVAPAIVALALALGDRKRRLVSVPMLILLLTAVLTGQITSAVACVAGMIALVFLRSRKAGLFGSLALIITVTLFITAFAPLRQRVSTIASLAGAGDYAEATSGRITPFAAALLMTRDHPLLGVGPGCFRWEYFPYKVEVERLYPALGRQFAHSFNFGEAHNDHLQALAEVGFVGYGLGLALLILVSRASFTKMRADSDDTGVNTARLVCFPLAVSLFVLCLGHFPLHLAAPSLLFLYAGGVAYSQLTVGPEKASAPGRISSPLLTAAVAAVVATAAVAGMYVLSYRPYRANLTKKSVEDATRATLNIADPYVTARRARSNLAAVRGCADSWPVDVDCQMLAAANYRLLGRVDDALAMYQRALRHERRPELYFSLAETQLDARDERRAIENYAEAVRFNRDVLPDVPAQLHDAVLAMAARPPSTPE